MILSVFETPEQVPALSETPTPDCAIAVDVLRATTTMATALAAGAEAIQVFSDLDRLRTTGSAWPADKRILAGERGGNALEGFDLGNSPLSYTSEVVHDKRIFMSTTNGTRCLQTIQSVPVVITAALVNLDAVIHFVKAQNFNTVWIVSSGWEGSYSLEDSVCAGAIVYHLDVLKNPAQIGNDEALAAAALYQQWQHHLVELLRLASHGQRLLKLGPEYDQDIQYCATVSSVNCVPRQTDPGVLAMA